MTLQIFVLSFQRRKACSNQRPITLDMTFLVKVIRRKNIGVRMKFRRHCRRGSQKFLFIELIRTGLQTRLFGKIEFFERPNDLSSCPNGGTFDHYFAYRITQTKTYRVDDPDNDHTRMTLSKLKTKNKLLENQLRHKEAVES